MSKPLDLVVLGGTCLTPAGPARVDVGVRAGRIVSFGDLSAAEAVERIDARGLHVLPGVIDTQVHFREPGLEHKEDLQTGTAAAALGGVTTVFEMPNTKPSTTTPEALADKVRRATGRAWTNFAFFLGASPENADRLGEWERAPGCCGVKVFMGSSTGDLLVEDLSVLARALRSGRRRVAVHSEDEARLRERRPLLDAEGVTPAMHPVWRDAETAIRSTTHLLRLARETGRAVHVLHVTTAEEMALLAEHKDVATVEVTPQHLFFAAPECYERLGTLAQMNPPIREARHRDALWAALRDGVLDVIGTDHAPHTLSEKAQPYPKSPSGMTGAQTLVPLLLDWVHQGRLSLQHVVELVCHGPARVYNLAGKGRLTVGYDADLTLVDLNARRTITNAQQASRVGWTPYDGHTVTGWPMMTVVGGRVVMRDGELLGPPSGAPARFWDTLGG
ncbi:dihydroorotase [Myxococcota bacterium]|nr:dihydroorotase [Myxococcota bacterium]